MRGIAAHRKDIDGLRAVAILPVLFYHANIWPFAGGYVGVDVFFVLSGYLITGLILREQAVAGFSLRNFYDRRVRRILPALFAMLIASTIVAIVLLAPDELIDYGKSLLSSVLFSANVDFWTRQARYFAHAAAQMPLMHVWSLAVEEQFYLFWPLLLMATRQRRQWLPPIVIALGLGSAALAVVMQRVDPLFAFFMLPARAWELLLGAFLALGVVPSPRQAALRNAIAGLGLCLILVAAVIFADFRAVPLACAGCAAVLFGADGGDTLVSKILATRLPVFVGLISYSLYLWHWPMLVYARLFVNRELTVPEALGVLFAALAVSVLSWWFVEQPLRRRTGTWHGVPASFPVAAAAAVPLVGAAVVLWASDGLPGRLPAAAREAYAETLAPHRHFCEPLNPHAGCVHGAFPDEAVIWGDSHAQALAPGLVEFSARRHLTLREFTLASCPPLPEYIADSAARQREYVRCATFNTVALNAILASPRVRLVIVHADWANDLARRLPYDPKAASAFTAALAHLMDRLAAHHVAVLVVGSTPDYSDPPSHCFARAYLLGRDPQPCMTEPWRAGVHPIVPSERILFQAVAQRTAFARYHPAFADLCDRAGCHAFLAGRTMYVDKHHLSPSGAALIGQRLDAALRNWPR